MRSHRCAWPVLIAGLLACGAAWGQAQTLSSADRAMLANFPQPAGGTKLLFTSSRTVGSWQELATWSVTGDPSNAHDAYVQLITAAGWIPSSVRWVGANSQVNEDFLAGVSIAHVVAAYDSQGRTTLTTTITTNAGSGMPPLYTGVSASPPSGATSSPADKGGGDPINFPRLPGSIRTMYALTTPVPLTVREAASYAALAAVDSADAFFDQALPPGWSEVSRWVNIDYAHAAQKIESKWQTTGRTASLTFTSAPAGGSVLDVVVTTNTSQVKAGGGGNASGGSTAVSGGGTASGGTTSGTGATCACTGTQGAGVTSDSYGNTAAGTSALAQVKPVTTGSGAGGTNTAYGSSALAADTTGAANTAIGYESLKANTTGGGNVAAGIDSLAANTVGIWNTAVGVNALKTMPNGSENVAVGNSALQNTGQANYNTAVGGIALMNLTTGSGNVAVGRGAGLKLTGGSNNLYLASPGVDKDSGVIRIGDAQTHTATYIAGIAGASNPNATKPVLVDPSTGQLVAGSQTPPPAAQGFGTNNHPAIAGSGAACTLGDVILTAGAIGNGTPADGRLLNIIGNQGLFSTFGTAFGGDGKTTFALPDLRAMAPNGTTYMICTQGVFPTH